MTPESRIFTNCTLATMAADKQPYGLLTDAAFAVADGKITWVGAAHDAPDGVVVNLHGALVTPGLIDCHTHIVWGGNRAKEFELRLNGASYEELARAGGGIVSTVGATRDASEEELLSAALPRVDALLAEGVTMLEIKSGYGLNYETEAKMLRVARRIGTERDVDVVTSYLGAHAVPGEIDADTYIDEVCIPALHQIAGEGLADAVDGFCENIAFSVPQIRRVFEAAAAVNLPVKLHAEQLSNLGGAKLAAEYGAISVDHVEYLDEDGIAALQAAGTVAVLLPGAFYTLRETQAPPVEALRSRGVPMAVATDANPGSSPLMSLLLAMNMACTFFRMTPEEALAGVTRNAARALGFTNRGQIAPGLRGDFAVWDVAHPAELAYTIGYNPLRASYRTGALR
ncbi:MAG: imidazolonepropionase [Pseudomonadota bacterium]